MNIEVDARGLSCPQPVIKTKKELDNISNATIITLVDNEIARENIIKLANSMNCQVKHYSKENYFCIEITKGNNLEAKEVQPVFNIEDRAIMITSEFMGNGSQELGRILIKGFIYTLAQVEPHPKTIVFLNSGIKLTTENEEVIENLIALEKQGVEILSCGTCLDYYGLKDKLKVGKISNMYDIVEKIKGAFNSITI